MENIICELCSKETINHNCIQDTKLIKVKKSRNKIQAEENSVFWKLDSPQTKMLNKERPNDVKYFSKNYVI